MKAKIIITKAPKRSGIKDASLPLNPKWHDI